MFFAKTSIRCNGYILSLLAIFLLQSQPVYADAWKVHSTQEKVGSLVKYTIRITDWDFSSTLPNPLYGCDIATDYCSVALSMGSGQTFAGTEIMKSKGVVSAKTIGELGLYLQTTGKWFGKTHEVTLSNKRECSYPGSMPIGGFHRPLPGGECTYGEITPTTCKFDMQSLEIRHAEYDKNVNGSRVSENINVTCTEPMKVRIQGQYSGVDSIVLDSKSNFKSILTLNNKPLSSGVVIDASILPKTVAVTSTLNGTPPPGEYQGSTVIIISME